MRFNFAKDAPDAYKAMLALSGYSKGRLDAKLLELIKIRASQINACAFCINMHAADAHKLGETNERIDLLPAWREAPVYTPRERAALAWTEALTLVADSQVPDDVYEEAKRHFSDTELADLSIAVVVINSWNRLMVAFRVPPAIKATAAAA